ncbi:TPA: lytic transglycosylase domain-containing protein [Serratia marcescens]
MNAETIKDFLISLGFEIDSTGERKFSAVVAGVTANVLKMGAAVEGAALTIVGFTTQIANGLDKVYFASQRTGASVAGIHALGYAASQMGADAAAAQGSLESLARFIRNNPGAEGFLNRLGVQTRGANGQMRDAAAIFTGVGDKLRSMPYYRANQYAQMLGIDENTLLAMRRGINGFTADYQSMLKATGLNADRAAQQSNKFMTSMRSLTALLGMAKDKIGSGLAGGLSGSLDTLRRRIMDNFPKIEGFITKTVRGVLWLAEVFGRMLYRGYQAIDQVITWWKSLDTESRKLIGIFGALLVAWRLLNSAFLMSPIGMITALIVGIGLLWDDYRTWKEGGKSLIDWAKWEPAITQAKNAMIWLRDKLLELKDAVGGWKTALEILAGFVAVSWAAKMVSAIGSVTKSVGGLSKAMGGLGKVGVIGGLLAVEEAVVKPLEGKYSWLTDNPVASFLNQLPGSDTVDEWGRKLLPWRQGEPAQHAQSAGTPRGIRNNNPGNIDYVGQAGATLERPGGRFARFETAFDGLKAMARQLLRYFDGKTTGRRLQTISEIISTWAPGNENNTAAYIKRLSDVMGVSPNARLNLRDPSTMSALMGGIIHHENGRNPYSSEVVGMAARSATGGASVQQETNIHIHGVSDPARAGMEVADRQTGVNSRLTQQLYARPQ